MLPKQQEMGDIGGCLAWPICLSVKEKLQIIESFHTFVLLRIQKSKL